MSIGKIDRTAIMRRRKEYKESRYVHGYEVTGDNDVILNYQWLGAWAGHRATEMAIDHDGRKTLRWILEHNFSTRLKELLEAILEDYH